jgi:hypothetical protein
MNQYQMVVLFTCLMCAAPAGATERKAYKYVDEQGNVTYSQNPPAGKDAKAVDISPAHQGRGGQIVPGPAYRSDRGWNADRRNDALREQQRRREEAQQKRLAQLEAECVRQRGTDCRNPDSLRYMDSQSIPRRHR